MRFLGIWSLKEKYRVSQKTRPIAKKSRFYIILRDLSLFWTLFKNCQKVTNPFNFHFIIKYFALLLYLNVLLLVKVDKEYFLFLRNWRLFWETLYLQIIILHQKRNFQFKSKYGRSKSV